jgi:pimeloyl-ACP methyl ester carboxylesterase
MTDAPPPDVPAALLGRSSSGSYTLSDMAADAVGLMDALGLDGAHLVGASMGGMIAQVAAIEHPRRVRSLTSINVEHRRSVSGPAKPGGAGSDALTTGAHARRGHRTDIADRSRDRLSRV